MRKANGAEIRKIGETFNETMSSEIRSLQSLFEMISGAGKDGARLFTTSNTSLWDWEKTHDGLTPYTTVIFSKDMFSRVLSFNAPLKAVYTFQKYGECDITDVERCSLSAQTLVFRLQPSDKKFQYLEDIGKFHSDFKFSLRATRFTTFILIHSIFKPKPSDGNGALINDAVAGIHGKIERPSWLENGYVTNDHIIEARAFTETPGKSRKENARRKPTKDNIACHGALHVYRQLRIVLQDGRGNMRLAFFHGLDFLLVPWKGLVADIDQNSLELAFLGTDSSDNVTSLRLDDLPCANQCAQNANDKTVSTADASNKRALKDLLFSSHGMILTATHEVMVTQSVQQRSGRNGGKKKSIHRLVNLVDVALDCYVEFCRVGSREIFLRSSKNSFRCVMIFATLFKALCIEFMVMSNMPSNSSVTSIPEPTDVKVYGTCLKYLILGLSTQKSLLGKKCFHMSDTLYDVFNHVSSDVDPVIDSLEGIESGGIFDPRRIEESAEGGVCQI